MRVRIILAAFLAIVWSLSPALLEPRAFAGGDDEATPPGDLSGTYVCEQFRLDLVKASDGSYDGGRTSLERRGAVLSASAKVVERGPDRVVLQGDFATFKQTFPFRAAYQGSSLHVTSIFSEYRLLRVARDAEHREFAGTGFGGRPIRLALEREPGEDRGEDRPGAATLIVDGTVKHAVSYHRYGESMVGTIAMDDRTLDFTGSLRGLLLNIDIGPESYALAAVGGSAINLGGLRTWFVNAAAYDAAARQLVFTIFTRGPITEAEREQADFRFALLSKDGLRSAGQASVTDLPMERPASKPPANAPRAVPSPVGRVYRAQLVVPAAASLLERTSVIRLEQTSSTRATVAPR